MNCEYIPMINKMIEKITSEKKLHKIYNYICFVYLKCKD